MNLWTYNTLHYSMLQAVTVILTIQSQSDFQFSAGQCCDACLVKTGDPGLESQQFEFPLPPGHMSTVSVLVACSSAIIRPTAISPWGSVFEKSSHVIV